VKISILRLRGKAIRHDVQVQDVATKAAATRGARTFGGATLIVRDSRDGSYT
jgi:hypothetical protein